MNKKTVQERAFELYEEGYRHEVIADRLGIKANSCRQLVCRERRKRGIEPFKPVGFHINRVLKKADKARKRKIPYAGAE